MNKKTERLIYVLNTDIEHYQYLSEQARKVGAFDEAKQFAGIAIGISKGFNPEV